MTIISFGWKAMRHWFYSGTRERPASDTAGSGEPIPSASSGSGMEMARMASSVMSTTGLTAPVSAAEVYPGKIAT